MSGSGTLQLPGIGGYISANPPFNSTPSPGLLGTSRRRSRENLRVKTATITILSYICLLSAAAADSPQRFACSPTAKSLHKRRIRGAICSHRQASVECRNPRCCRPSCFRAAQENTLTHSPHAPSVASWQTTSILSRLPQKTGGPRNAVSVSWRRRSESLKDSSQLSK